MAAPADTSSPSTQPDSKPSSLLPIMLLVLISFLVIGFALPVLPLHVHNDLGMGTFMVGLVTGCQFAASLLSRLWAGRYADRRGAKRAVVFGLAGATLAGLFYVVSDQFGQQPIAAVILLLAGRAVLGAAESFIITGALSWGLARSDPKRAGKVIAWVGTSMYSAFAVGAPLGTLLYDALGFPSVSWATMLLPGATLVLTLAMRSAPLQHQAQASMGTVVVAVWVSGVALALSSLGFGAMTAFIALLFSQQGWTPIWLAFTVFAVTFILARFLFGHLPDRYGGARIAMLFVLVEAAGQLTVWLAGSAQVALIGAALTGLGYSLVYPGPGVEAVKQVPLQSRGMAMGTYTAFLDLTLGLTTPLLGLLADHQGLPVIFLVGAFASVGCALVTLRLMSRGHKQTTPIESTRTRACAPTSPAT